MANTDYLSAVETRLHAILHEGRGTDGTLGTEAQTRALPAGTFRRQADNADLRDAAMPAETFDRGYVLRFTAAQDATTGNPYQTPQFKTVRLEIFVGYLYGAAYQAFLDAQGTETQEGQRYRADRRAISDGVRIARALRFRDLRGVDTDPVIVRCGDASTQWVDLGGGRSLGVTTIEMTLESNELTDYWS